MPTSEERKFLHDLSTPISTVFFLLDMVIEKLKEDTEKNQLEIKMLESAVKSMQSAKELMRLRREDIISRETLSNQEKKNAV
jgi:hypothetical protein